MNAYASASVLRGRVFEFRSFDFLNLSKSSEVGFRKRSKITFIFGWFVIGYGYEKIL